MTQQNRDVFSYLEWRGDLSLPRNPFNDVDNLILSICSYLNYEGIVPDFGEGAPILFPEAMKIFLHLPDSYRHKGLVVPDAIERLVILTSISPRFQKLRLIGYRSILDKEAETQFAAVSFLLPNDDLFIAFRGTDDNLIGWKEDLNMSFLETIPAQSAATEYLKDAARAYPTLRMRVGGHSKGGNLAIYAAVTAEPSVRRRIIKVYSNDGPGFRRSFLDSPAYKAMEPKLISFIPEASLVGTIFDHDENFYYIRSNANGVFQHDPFTWQIERNFFVVLPEQSKDAKHYTAAAYKWLSSLSEDDRIFFSNTVYLIMKDTGLRTLGDVNRNRLRTFTAGAKTLFSYDTAKRNRFLRLFHGLVSSLNLRKKFDNSGSAATPHPENISKKKPIRRKKK